MPFTFQNIDAETAAKKLNLIRSGRTDGVNNFPPESATNLSTKESEIVDFCKKHYLKGIEKSVDDSEKIALQLGDINALLKKNGHKEFLGNVKREAKKVLADSKREISEAKNDIKSKELEIDRLRVKLDIEKREPNKRGPLKLFFSVLLLVVMAVTEMALNFFGLSSGDYIAGQSVLILVILVTFVNIVLSFSIGYGVLRWLWNVPTRSNAEKLFDRIKIFGYGILLIWLNMTIAVVRGVVQLAETAESEAEEAEAFAYAVWPFSSDALSNLTYESNLLLATGITFAILSLIDGYYFDDRVPGFGAKGRDRDKAKKEIKKLQKAKSSQLYLLFQSNFKQLESVHRSRLNAVEEWAALMDKVQVAADKFNLVFKENISSTQSALISIYRSNNEGERNTPVPSYFSKTVATDYMEDFLTVHSNIATDIVLEDKQKHEKHDKFKKLVEDEYGNTFQELTELSEEFSKDLYEL